MDTTHRLDFLHLPVRNGTGSMRKTTATHARQCGGTMNISRQNKKDIRTAICTGLGGQRFL
jgi:hypothetical protein